MKASTQIILFLFFVLLSLDLQAQFQDNIASGRPGNANGAFSVGKGVYQVQFGQNFIQSSNTASEAYKDAYPKERMISGPDVLFRIGLTEQSELRLGGLYSFSDQIKYDNENVNQDLSGLSAIVLGIRSTLFMQKGVLPTTAIQFTTEFGGGGDYKQDLPLASFRLNLGNRITEKLNLNWNFISRWIPDNKEVNGFYIFSFSYSLRDALSVTAEAFGNIDETTKLNTGLGLSYILNSNFQLDAYSSYGSNKIQGGNVTNEVINFNAGISYRIVNRDN